MKREEFTTGPLVLDEMMKIFSLLSNPPDAIGVRQALRFYELPEKEDYEWGNISELMTMLKHYSCAQDKVELEQMLKLVAGSKSVLEIGSSFGGTLKQMASVMPRGSTIVAVDMPSDETPKYLNQQASLKEVCRQLSILGANVQLILGDSHSAQVIERVSHYAPFDFVFIDGDHSYEGMKKDWENYGPMGKVIAFHDIAGGLPECKRCWDEIKATGVHTEEIINKYSKQKFGIGIVYQE